MQTPEDTDLGGRGVTVTRKKHYTLFLKWIFIGKFSMQAKIPRFKEVFHLTNFFDLANVSVQVILFPLNLILRASLTFLTRKIKEALERC